MSKFWFIWFFYALKVYIIATSVGYKSLSDKLFRLDELVSACLISTSTEEVDTYVFWDCDSY